MANVKNRTRSPTCLKSASRPLYQHSNPIYTWLGDASDNPSSSITQAGGLELSIPKFNYESWDGFLKAKTLGVEPSMAHHSQLSYDSELSKTIVWDASRARPLVDTIKRKKSLDEVKQYYPEAYMHAQLMLERLTFQSIMYKIKCTFSPIEMVAMSFNYGPEFASMWKRAWEAGRLDFLGVQTWQENPKDFLINSMDWSQGVNGVYHFRHFIFWKEECEDYKYSLDPPLEENQEALEELRSEATRLGKKYLKQEDFGDEIDILLETMPVSSSTFLEKKGKAKKEWEAEYYDLYSLREEPRLRGIQSNAPKRPGETRDITIPSPGVLRACKRLNRPLKQALKRVLGCPFGKDNKETLKIMEDHDDHDYHYMRDFRKIGLTLPKSVIRAFLEGFFYKHPDFSSEIIEFFCNTELLIKENGHERWAKTLSGFHMGFFNEGLTWIQYAVHSLTMSRMSKRGRAVKFSAFNDDSLISCMDPDRLKSYVIIDQSIWDDLRCPLSYNKCGVSYRSFVYLEEVFKDNERLPKDMYYAVGIIGALFAINIVHAKDYVNSITQSMDLLTFGVKMAIEKVVRHWGYEYYPHEAEKPFLFGGWITPKKDGLDASILYFTNSRHERAAYKAVTTCKAESKTIKKSKGWTFMAKFLDLQLWEEIPPYLDQLSGASVHFLDETSARKAFSRLSLDPKALIRTYSRLKKKRERIFQDKQSSNSVLEDWFIKHPNSLITSHTCGQATEIIDCMDRDAQSMLSGKPQRLVYQTLINEGIIRSSKSHVIKFGKTVHEILMKGYIYDIPKTMLPRGKYVHETLLLGQSKAYLEFFNRTGCAPIPKSATVPTEVVLFASEQEVPWQVAYAAHLEGDINKSLAASFSILKERKEANKRKAVEEIPRSPSSPDEEENLVIPGSLLFEMMKASDPEWTCTLPIPSSALDVYNIHAEEILGSRERASLFLSQLTDLCRRIGDNDARGLLSLGGGSPLEGHIPGIDDLEDIGEDLFNLFDEG